jgi:hypothetical protein
MKTRILITTIALSGLGLAAQATSWDLASQYSPVTPTAPWSYGSVLSDGSGFTSLAWDAATSTYGVGLANSGAFVYKNVFGGAAYGVANGQVSLESDWGDAAVQWTAPSTGVYNIVAAIGGTQATEGTPAVGYGTGNAFAQYAGLSVNGVRQTGSFSDNVKSWDLTDISLLAGQTIEAYVINPGGPGSGNTQTELTISQVPDGGLTGGLLGGALLGLGALRRKWFV